MKQEVFEFVGGPGKITHRLPSMELTKNISHRKGSLENHRLKVCPLVGDMRDPSLFGYFRDFSLPAVRIVYQFAKVKVCDHVCCAAELKHKSSRILIRGTDSWSSGPGLKKLQTNGGFWLRWLPEAWIFCWVLWDPLQGQTSRKLGVKSGIGLEEMMKSDPTLDIHSLE